MEFREWLLNEMPHVMVDPPVEIMGRKISFIDMQFELYPPHLKTNEQLAKWTIGGFAAKIPESDLWLVYNGRTARAKISTSPEGREQVPNDWWNQAYLSAQNAGDLPTQSVAV